MLIALNRLGLAALICAAFVCTCFAGPSSGPESKEVGDDDEKFDDSMADMMLEMYENGSMKVMYAVQLHDKAKEGQFWKTRMVSNFGGVETKTSDLWQVVKIVGKQAIIENRSGHFGGVVVAYQVDMTVTGDDVWKKGNVLKAWVGKGGQAPVAAQIMEVPDMAETPKAPEAADYETTTEDFKDLELASGKWSGKKTTVKMGDSGYVSASWMADNGWFTKVVKMEFSMDAGTMTQELVKYGAKGKALLKWDGVKIEEVKVERKEEKKDEKKDDGGKESK